MSSPLLRLIERNDWGEFQPMMDRLSRWEGWPLFLEKRKTLNRDALYQSPVHGYGHIERTMLHGAFCAMEEPLPGEDTALLLECCAYHDVGRSNDGPDQEHGHRSAARLEALTGRRGEELSMMMAAVDAHARPESALEPTLKRYHPADWARCLRLAQLLKDADGLDRVRIWDLDVKYLRREASRLREDFAEYLFIRYQREINASTTPPFPQELVEMLSARQDARNRVRNRTSYFHR